MAWNEIIIDSWKKFNSVIEIVGIHKDSILPLWVYRGQSNSTWTLKSSLHRKLNSISVTQEVSLAVEKMLIMEFKQKSSLYAQKESIIFKNIITWLCMMQHYSCPTRLLDWSESPFIALFFAIENNFTKDGAIYMFNSTQIQEHFREEIFNAYLSEKELLDYKKGENILIPLYPTFPADRFIIQKGFFTLSTNIFTDHYSIIDQVYTPVETNEKKFHIKLVIKKELKKEFLSRLRTMNIEYSSLFPGLDGLGKALDRLIDIRSFIEEWK
jgi:FRG domain